MEKFICLIVVLLCITKELVSQYPKCYGNQDSVRTVKVSFASRKNETGQWVDNFSAQAIVNEATDDDVGMNLTKTTISCDGRRYIQIGGISDALLPKETSEVYCPTRMFTKLVFDNSCGKNVLVVNGGRTLRKKKQPNWSYALGVTKRPLADNEIFQVRLDELDDEGSIIIGVYESKPENASQYEVLSDQIKHWGYVEDKIYINGVGNIRNDGISLDELKVGETVGVMRTESGDLHFFFDGVDIGVGATGLPPNVYGFFDLYGVGKRATIVNS